MAEDKYKALYIDLLKRSPNENICEKCVHNPDFTCDKSCPEYIEGQGGLVEGRPVDFRWSCRDFDWGDCLRMETTPCHGCYNDNFCNFVLREDDVDA